MNEIERLRFENEALRRRCESAEAAMHGDDQFAIMMQEFREEPLDLGRDVIVRTMSPCCNAELDALVRLDSPTCGVQCPKCPKTYTLQFQMPMDEERKPIGVIKEDRNGP